MTLYDEIVEKLKSVIDPADELNRALKEAKP